MKTTDYPAYTVVIRTLGTAGGKYLQTLRSADAQTVAPEAILVYIAHGCPLPKETIGRERYIYCQRGMVAQRSLPFDEVKTEYILFLDDDVYLPPAAVEQFFSALGARGADCITPNVFANHRAPLLTKLRWALYPGTLPHLDPRWAFKIRRSSAFSYNLHPAPVMPTQSGSFNCLLVKKSAYAAIHYADERWLDRLGYALGDDLLFFYKLYRMGFKVLVHYESGVEHLDAGAGGGGNPYVSGRMRYLMWWRTQYSCAQGRLERYRCCWALAVLLAANSACWLLASVLRARPKLFREYVRGLREAVAFSRSPEARSLPPYPPRRGQE